MNVGWSVGWLVSAFILLSLMSAQYPLHSTFPMGNDTTRFIMRAQEVYRLAFSAPRDALESLTTNSAYPGAILLLAATDPLPLDWPEKFTWWMVVAHIAVGLSVGGLLMRLSGWQAAAVGMVVWSATATLNGHYVNGIFAHLISMAALLVCFERVAAGRLLHSLALGVITFLLHPMTGFLLMLVLGVVTATVFVPLGKRQMVLRKNVLLILGLVGVLVWLGSNFLVSRGILHVSLPRDGFANSLQSLLEGHFGTALILAPFGYVGLALKSRQRTTAVVMLLSFAVVSILLAFNGSLGVSLQVRRFYSYFLLALTIGAALALPEIVRRLTQRQLGQAVLTTMVLAPMILGASQADAYRYYRFETEEYSRLHSNELLAIQWLTDNTQPTARIVSTNRNRHSEWIPIISDRWWEGLDDSDDFFSSAEARCMGTHVPLYDYLVIFSGRESVGELGLDQSRCQLIYVNDGAQIYDLENRNNTL